MKVIENDYCSKCGFISEYGYCECPSSHKWYACPIESRKPENIQALKEYAEWQQVKREVEK